MADEAAGVWRVWVAVAAGAAALWLGGQVQAEPAAFETVRFHSEALDEARDYGVLLPAGYEATERPWPMLVMLHGRGRHMRSLVDDEAAWEALAGVDFVIVFPQGDDGWYIDSPARPGDRYEAHMAEVVADAEARFRVRRSRQGRALAGWSMGGYGAVRLAQQWREGFGAVVSIIGLLDFPRTNWPGEPPYAVPEGRFTADPAVHRRLNPLHEAAALERTQVLLIAADDAFDRPMNENFRVAMEQAGLEPGWVMLEGGHTFEVVRKALPHMVKYLEGVFASTDDGS